LDEVIQHRFAAPPALLGMSRVASPASLGEHFRPSPGAVTDFRPESPAEESAIRSLGEASLQVGMYVFGAAIERADFQARDYRALKGPAVLTAGTLRPAWYPPLMSQASNPDALPDWNTAYPIAREAMKRFERGDRSFTASVGLWRMIARPVPASSETCVMCHNAQQFRRSARSIALHDAIGGVLYVFRR
jgi:hypothetical protein